MLSGVVGPTLFVIGFLVIGASRSGYDPARVMVSMLSLDGGGWLQIANFIVAGSLILAFALGQGWVPRSMPLSALPVVGLPVLWFVL